MDFVKKKALETQLKKAGLDGLKNPLSGSSSSNKQETWSVFRKSDANTEMEAEEAQVFPVSAACLFDSRANNFPPLLNLFYIDHSILSDAAAPAVKWAFRVFCLIEILLAFNTGSAILFLVLNEGRGVVELVLSAVVTVLLSIYEMVVYETAFRGAYRTSSNLRMRYLLMSIANLIVVSLYAFLGVGFFNGWSRIANILEDGQEESASLRMGFAGMEAVGWSMVLFLNTYTMFDYYHVYKGRDQGLSAACLEEARNGRTGQEDVSHGGGDDSDDGGRAKVEEIRDRYSSR